MNIFEKLALARADFKASGVKQSGNNKFAGYTYFELADILPKTTELEKKYKMLSVVSYGNETATLTLYNAEAPDEKIVFESPMSKAELKGCHPVQNLGAVETYVRRYLYLAAYEIVETEALDRTQGKPDTVTERPQTPTQPKPQSQPQTPTQPQQTTHSDLTLEQALKISFKNGKSAGVPFSELKDHQLEWVGTNYHNIYGEAAKLVLAYRKQQAGEQQQIPFDGLTPTEPDDGLPF